MTLYELAFVCYVFDRTDKQRAYEAFLRDTNEHPDLFDGEHREALLRFLNKWGCRHIAIKHHQQASEEIGNWYGAYNGEFFGNDINLWELGEEHLALANKAHQDLSGRQATPTARIGATAAAKVLFAIKPNALVAWDDNIRTYYRKADGTYGEFLKKMKCIALDLSDQCQNDRFEIAELPQQLGTPNKTVCKLIDEYNWMTISRGFAPPDMETLMRWVGWYD